MNFLKFLSLFLLSHPSQYCECEREILRDYPGCGQLGDPGKKECFWGCEWETNPLLELRENNSAIEVIEAKLQPLGKCQDCVQCLYLSYVINNDPSCTVLYIGVVL